MITSCQTCGLVIEAESTADHKLKCPRCFSLIIRSREDVRMTLTLSITALIFMIPASFFPFIRVQINEITASANIFQTASIMINDGYPLAGSVIFITVIALPFFYLALITYISSACYFGIRFPFVWKAMHMLDIFQYFQMTDVFIVGILISIVKLVDISDVTLDKGFYFLALYSIIIISIDLLYDKHLIWCRRKHV